MRKLEIKKGNINLKEQIAGSSSSLLVEGDIVVPDTKPDMTEILVADANAVIEGTEYKNDELIVSGTVFFKVLYKPDEDAELKSLEHAFGFSQKIDIKANENAEFMTEVTTEHIGFTMINSRKLSAKVMLLIKALCYEEKMYKPIIEAQGDEIESREKKYSIYIPMSDTESEISLSDLLTVPDDMPDIDEILKIDTWVTASDHKVMNGKAMVHGDLHITTIYTAAGEDKNTVSVKHTVPFTEIVEAPGADEQSAVNVNFWIKNIFAASKGDINGDTKIISIEGIICSRVKVCKSVVERIVDDCYFLSGKTELLKDSMKIYEYVTSENVRISENQTANLPKNVTVDEIISVSAKPILREACWENGIIKIKGSLVTFLIYRDDQEGIRCAVTESDINWQKPLSDSTEIETRLYIEDIDARKTDDGVQIIANIGLFMKALRPRRIDILTDCNFKEENENKKYPSMVIYFAKDGDTVWSIAKKYRTKAEKIKSANKLETEKIASGRRILIPKA